MTSTTAISWPPPSQSCSLGPFTLNSLIKICLLFHSKRHLTRLVIFHLTLKTFLQGLIPFYRHVSRAQVTSQRVSHELSRASWKQNDWRGDKRFIPVCFALQSQLKVNVLWSFFRKCSPFLMRSKPVAFSPSAASIQCSDSEMLSAALLRAVKPAHSQIVSAVCCLWVRHILMISDSANKY